MGEFTATQKHEANDKAKGVKRDSLEQQCQLTGYKIVFQLKSRDGEGEVG